MLEQSEFMQLWKINVLTKLNLSLGKLGDNEKKERGYILGKTGSLLAVADFRARALEFLEIVTLKRALGEKS